MADVADFQVERAARSGSVLDLLARADIDIQHGLHHAAQINIRAAAKKLMAELPPEETSHAG